MAEEIMLYVVNYYNDYNHFVAGIFNNEDDAEQYISRMLKISPEAYYRIEYHILKLS